MSAWNLTGASQTAAAPPPSHRYGNCVTPTMRPLYLILLLAQPLHTAWAQPVRVVGTRTSRVQTVVSYPDHLAGRKMAGGGLYNPNGLTAAHATLPFGTMLELTSQASGRSVMVKVTDRGLGLDAHALVVSAGAVERLGFLEEETGQVTVKVWDGNPEQSAVASTTPRPASPENPPQPAEQVPPPATRPPTGTGGGYAVQIGSYKDQAAATAQAAKLDKAWVLPVTVDDRVVHRVYYGRFASRADADAWQARLASLGFPGYVKTLD